MLPNYKNWWHLGRVPARDGARLESTSTSKVYVLPVPQTFVPFR